MRVLLVRHGEWKWAPGRNEDEFPLSPEGRARARRVRAALRRANLRPDAYLSSRWRHAKDTAQILRGRDARVDVVGVTGLTPKTAESRFTWRGIINEAVSQGVGITDRSILALVGHEPRLRQLCDRVTGVDLTEIARLEVVVVHATSLQALLRKRATVERRLLPTGSRR